MKYKYTDVITYWQSLKIDSKEKLENVLDNFRILFAYNSGAIENAEITYHDTREIFENGKVISFTGNLRTIFEISNQKTCYEYLLDKIIKKEKISENLIKKVHELLTIGTYDERRYISNGERPGEYKKHDYVTGREEVGVSASEVEKEIENLVNEWIQEGLPVVKQEMKKEDAIKSGAECMFVEKYPDIVTVYTIGDISKELCGGPHVENTSKLGTFKIKKEESSSSGVRRIKAVLIK